MLIARPASLIEGRAHETILEDGARRGVPRWRLAPAAPGGTGPRPPGTTTRTRGARCDRSGSNSGEGSAGPERKIGTVRAPGGERRPYGTQGASLGAWPAALRAGPTGASQAPDDSRRSATPSIGVSEAKVSKPGRKKRAAGTNRCCLVLTLSVRHSGRAAIAARAGIHNHRPWVWIPGSRAEPVPGQREALIRLPAPRTDARKM